MACFYDAHWREAPLYAVRDKVWLNRQNITMTCLMKKLDHKWLSPYPWTRSSPRVIPTQTAIIIQLERTQYSLIHPVTNLQRRRDNRNKFNMTLHLQSSMAESRNMRWNTSQTAESSEGKLCMLERYSIEEDEWRPSEMSKVQGDLCLSSTGKTPKHPNISQPSTSLTPPSAPYQLHGYPDTVPTYWATGRCALGSMP